MKKKPQRQKQTVYEVFLQDENATFPDGSNSRIVYNYQDALKLQNSYGEPRGRKRNGKRKKRVSLFGKIQAIPMSEVNERINQKMQEIIANAKAEKEKEEKAIEAETDISEVKKEVKKDAKKSKQNDSKTKVQK